MTEYRVRARRWDGGWELHIAGEGVTQARTLGQARQQVLDYLATVHDDLDLTDARVHIEYDLGGLEDEVVDVRTETARAAASQRDAARHRRQVTTTLRNLGLSVSDVAALLGVSRGRISQLTRDGSERRAS